MKNATKLDVYTSADLTSAALSYTTSTNRKFQLTEVIVKASENITETITVTRVSKNGTNYNVILDSWDLVAEQNYVFRPQGDCVFEAGDEIKVECTKANVTGSVYVTIKRREIN